MANTVYDNFFLSNEVEDQFNSHLDLAQFCTVDRNLEGTAGMKRIIHVYSATNGNTEKLTKGQGNSKSISVSYAEKEYEILLAQNKFDYFDEEAMTDPNIVPVGVKHAGTELFNTANADIYAEYAKADLKVDASTFDFAAFVDASAKLGLENIENVSLFAFVHPDDMGAVRKALKDDLKYVESFARNGYVGTVAGINLYQKADAIKGTIIVATKDAVTLFVKTGVETEQDRDKDTRHNFVYSRKYYLAALTDATKAVKIVKGA